jgi:hypothetical protein
MFEGKINHFLSQVPPDLLIAIDDSAGRIVREPSCNDQEISPVYIIQPCFSMLVHTGQSVAAVQRLTPQEKIERPNKILQK